MATKALNISKGVGVIEIAAIILDIMTKKKCSDLIFAKLFYAIVHVNSRATRRFPNFEQSALAVMFIETK